MFRSYPRARLQPASSKMAQMYVFLRARCHYIKVRASSAGVTPQVLEDPEKETIRGLESKLQVNK